MRLVARSDVQALVSRLPVGRALARRDGGAIFEILQGFVASQVLSALVELGILRDLLDGPRTAENLGLRAGVPAGRMEQLMRAGVALGLLDSARRGRYRLARRGAAILGVPGLEAMIRHNRAFYADMADPVAVLRGDGETELQRFWPYVLGAAGEAPAQAVERYSDLMAQSQVLVAQDTLRMIRFSGIRRLLDVGGGSGAFLGQVLRRHSHVSGLLFDLPGVLPSAESHLARQGLLGRVAFCPGDFRHDALPAGADAAALIRVLYDHEDATVAALLSNVYEALPQGGRLIVSEPMSGGDAPDRAGDVYFAFYTMAMGTGKVRSAEDIAALCRAAGFEGVRIPRAPRPFITSALICTKPRGARTSQV